MLTAWVGFLIENLQTHGHIILINVKVNHFAWMLGGLSFSCQQGKPEEDYCGIITRLITCDLQSWVMHSLSSSCQQNKCKTGRPVLFLPCSPTLFSSSFLFFPPLALSLPVLIALPHLCWFYLRWWLFDACVSRLIHIPSTGLSAPSRGAHSSFSRYVCPPPRLSCQEAWSPLTSVPALFISPAFSLQPRAVERHSYKE